MRGSMKGNHLDLGFSGSGVSDELQPSHTFWNYGGFDRAYTDTPQLSLEDLSILAPYPPPPLKPRPTSPPPPPRQEQQEKS